MSNTQINRTFDPQEEINESLLFVKPVNSLFIKNDAQPKNDLLTVYDADELTINSSNLKTAETVRVLHSIKATIYEVSTEFLRLKVKEDAFVNIPKSVFSGKEDLIKYGQSIIYSIKERQNGRRFQDIDLDTNITENPIKEQILDLLNNIKYKDES
ncbi:TPA: hypothetical protein I8Z61_001259 [Legionella pneumophila]|nr:hypothetical protein [Legionella pneumophila]